MSIISNTTDTIYDGYSVASTGYVYTSEGSSALVDGWFSARYDDTTLQIGVATLTATYVEYRIEGRGAGITRPAEIYNASINAAAAIDELVTVSEAVNEVRIGVKANNTATPNNIYCYLIHSDKK